MGGNESVGEGMGREEESEEEDQVGELPPKIEDVKVEDYEEEEEEGGENELPTVVIDSSLDDKDNSDDDYNKQP